MIPGNLLDLVLIDSDSSGVGDLAHGEVPTGSVRKVVFVGESAGESGFPGGSCSVKCLSIAIFCGTLNGAKICVPTSSGRSVDPSVAESDA